VIPSKGSGKVSHFQSFLPPFSAVSLRHVPRSLAPHNLRGVRGALHLHPQQEQRQAKAEAPASSDVEAESDPTGNCLVRWAFSAPGCASPQSRPRAARGMRTTDLFHLPPGARVPSIHLVGHGRLLCFLSLSRHNTRAAGGAKPRRGAAAFLSFSRVRCMFAHTWCRPCTVPMGWMEFASGPDEARQGPMLRPKPG
jgi:hypothetical protein